MFPVKLMMEPKTNWSHKQRRQSCFAYSTMNNMTKMTFTEKTRTKGTHYYSAQFQLGATRFDQ